MVSLNFSASAKLQKKLAHKFSDFIGNRDLRIIFWDLADRFARIFNLPKRACINRYSIKKLLGNTIFVPNIFCFDRFHIHLTKVSRTEISPKIPMIGHLIGLQFFSVNWSRGVDTDMCVLCRSSKSPRCKYKP